ncbi:Chitinase-3-like protein 2 [Bulinus truncatus]|nr:Chitinase-3-like protein 2 [Bulinus truncatus]
MKSQVEGIFLDLFDELRSAFHEESKYSGKKRLLLTAALAGDVTTYSESYEVDKIAKEVDYVSLLAYDLGIDQEEPFRNPSRIYGDTLDDKLNLASKYIVEHYVQQGVPSGKIVIGIPLYGWGYVHGWYSMDGKDQFTEPTYAIQERGVVAYFQACQMVELGRKVGTVNGAPYLTHGMLWVGYDDVYSISEKIWLSQRHNLSGFMLWSVDMDDVTKEWCMGYAFNMIEAADRACSTRDSGEDYVIDSKQPRSVWNLKKDSLAVGKSDNFVELTKPGEKQIDYPESKCHLYIQCRNGTGEMAFCPFLQAFDPTHKHCDFFDLIEECQ